MGVSPREAHNDATRPAGPDRSLQVPRVSQYDPVAVRRDDGRRVPVVQHAQGLVRPAHHPVLAHPDAAVTRRLDELSRVSLRLRFSRPHRLHHLPARQELQALARHVPPHHRVPQALPAVQIHGRGSRDSRRRCVYAALRQEGQEPWFGLDRAE